MDLDMPLSQKEAWDKLKKAVNEYAEITGSEIAVVTSYSTTPIQQTLNDAPGISSHSHSYFGHGVLLQHVRMALDRVKTQGSFQANDNVKNGWNATPGTDIPIRQSMGNGEQTHHHQSMARSLCSSYRSLKLGNRPHSGFSPQMDTSPATGESGAYPDSSPVHNKKKGGKRHNHKRSVQAPRRDNLEIDENLLFDEPSFDSSGGEDDEDFDSDDDSTDVSENGFGRHSNIYPVREFGQQPASAQMMNNQFATSLPVNISINWGQRNDGAPRFRDNEGPHPPIHRPPQLTRAPQQVPQPSRPGNRQFQETPNPETMMASIQALARSVTDDTSLIFGERPRPRLNTGESRLTRARR